jgi:hypothetical protein
MASVQEFFVSLTEKAAQDLLTALDNLPEENRMWSPMGEARTALDQVAECALLNGSTAKLLRDRTWGSQSGMDEFFNAKAELAKNEQACKATLQENLPKIVEAIRSVSDADLAVSVEMPWGPMTLGQIITYPYWNMSYHEGQINYLASMIAKS